MPDQQQQQRRLSTQGLSALYAHLGEMTHRALEAEAQLRQARATIRQLEAGRSEDAPNAPSPNDATA